MWKIWIAQKINKIQKVCWVKHLDENMLTETYCLLNIKKKASKRAHQENNDLSWVYIYKMVDIFA